MANKDDVSDEDRKLFRDTVGVVKPVASDRINPPARPPLRRKKLHQNIHEWTQPSVQPFSDNFLDSDAENPVEAGDLLFYARPGLQHKTIKRLKRGQLRFEATLDMHGLNVDEARDCLAEFIDACRQQRLRTVLIIHGKGFRSSGARPVLKSMVNNWLRQHEAVMAFSSAQPADGGSGAVYVLLKTVRGI